MGKRGPKPNLESCIVDGCNDRGKVRKMCLLHYDQWRRNDPAWSIKRKAQQEAAYTKRRSNPDPEFQKSLSESRNKTLQKYRLNNAETIKASALKYQRRRRSIKKSIPTEFYDDILILKLYGTKCHICSREIDLEAPRLSRDGEGWENGLHLDHVIPITKGGSDLIENIRPAHCLCNITKGNRIND